MALINKPFTFASGALIVASEHNSNFDTIYTDYNGGITNANISASAAISTTKLSGTILPANGGTGVANNAASTFTISGNFSLAFTISAGTSLTLPTSGTLATLAGSETLSSKTLTAPKIASAGFIADANGNELLIFTTTASAVNEVTYANGATGVPAKFVASGETNIGILLAGKGTGKIRVGDGADNTKLLTFDLVGATTAKTMTLTSSHTNDRTITLPDATDTLVGKATTDTLTNKRITKRAVATTQSATPAINTDVTDVSHITALAQAITSMTSSLSGTPVEGDTLRIDITDNGTARAITWGASFESSGTVTLPSTTVLGVRLDVGFFWNTVTSKWRCVGVS